MFTWATLCYTFSYLSTLPVVCVCTLVAGQMKSSLMRMERKAHTVLQSEHDASYCDRAALTRMLVGGFSLCTFPLPPMVNVSGWFYMLVLQLRGMTPSSHPEATGTGSVQKICVNWRGIYSMSRIFWDVIYISTVEFRRRSCERSNKYENWGEGRKTTSMLTTWPSLELTGTSFWAMISFPIYSPLNCINIRR